ncbi:MAG: DUF2149 domain-containing protein [Gordonibacter sp.]|nr:DUF2149 domain-containing protein [Gordonibacter sp.]
MPRDFRTNSFSSAGAYVDHEDADPRIGLVNLADVMLVFACGLMLALVVKWNIDLPNVQELDSSSMQEVSDVEKMVDAVNSSSSSYMELGKVYQDPNTGKLYMMTETEGSGDASASSSGANAGTSGDAAASSASSSSGSASSSAAQGGR